MITKMQTSFLKSIYILIIFLISACHFPDVGHSIPESVEPAQENEPEECAFMWANEPLPEVSKGFDKTLKNIQPEAEGYAQAYGENCVTNNGEVISFHAMETDFFITFKVNDLADKEELGTLIEKVMNVMEDFPTDETPGPQSGYISITFETPDNELRMRMMRTEIEGTLEDGLRGEALFNALQSK